MRTEEFIGIKAEGSKVILANGEAYANSLLRKLGIQEGVDIFDVQPMSIPDIAKELVIAHHALSDMVFPETVNPKEALYVLDKVLHSAATGR